MLQQHTQQIPLFFTLCLNDHIYMQTKKWLPHLNVEMVWLWNDWIICLQNIPNVTQVTIIFWLWTWSKVWPSGMLRMLKQVHFQFLINPCSLTWLVKEVETMPEVGREVMAAALCTYTIHCLSGVKSLSHRNSTQYIYFFISLSLSPPLNFLPIPINKQLYTLF